MVQTTKGGVAPKPEKPTKAQQKTDKELMDAMADSPGRSEPSDVKARNAKSTAAPTSADWVKDHPAGPASPSEAYNSGS